MTATGAAFARGGSKQDYSTPWEFIDAVERRFGRLDFDLASTDENCRIRKTFGTLPAPEIAPDYYHYGPGSRIITDALSRDAEWRSMTGNLWLNPPYDTIAPWAAKCLENACWNGDRDLRRIFFLVPASVGSEWYAQSVHQRALVLFVRPRLSFDGKNPYPKDCLLAVFGEKPGYECWRWK